MTLVAIDELVGVEEDQAEGFQRLAAEAPDLATPFLLAMGKTLTQRIRADNKRYRDSISFARASGG